MIGLGAVTGACLTWISVIGVGALSQIGGGLSGKTTSKKNIRRWERASYILPAAGAVLGGYVAKSLCDDVGVWIE